MVFLIAGASHTGKTALAQKILERYGYPYLSIDHLKMGLIRSGYTDLTPEDDDKLVGYLWPIIREIVKPAIENRQNLVIEGCYIPFDWAADFDPFYRKVAEFFWEQMESGECNPAQIMDHFVDEEEHKKVAESFISPIRARLSLQEQERAINDAVIKIKRESLEHRAANATDIGELQQIIKEQNNLQKIYITLN